LAHWAEYPRAVHLLEGEMAAISASGGNATITNTPGMVQFGGGTGG
jgi:hypothetical protein